MTTNAAIWGAGCGVTLSNVQGNSRSPVVRPIWGCWVAIIANLAHFWWGKQVQTEGTFLVLTTEKMKRVLKPLWPQFNYMQAFFKFLSTHNEVLK